MTSTGRQEGETMAKVNPEIGSVLDTDFPGEPEDYTDWQPDDETQERLKRLEAEDTGLWDLKPTSGDDK